MSNFNFDPSVCLNCEAGLPVEWTKVLCEKCDEPTLVTGLDGPDDWESPVPNQERWETIVEKKDFSRVGDMVTYESGYINPKDLIEGSPFTMVSEDAEVRGQPDSEFSLKVTRVKDVLMVETGHQFMAVAISRDS